MRIEDLVRVIACLGLLAVLVLIVATMKPRLFDRASRWLSGYVFFITLSAFLSTATLIGSGEELKWYGAPMRIIAVFFGLMYIWNARANHTKPEVARQDSGFKESITKDGLVDRMLKLMMPNGTVMRRWIAIGIVSGVVFGTVVSILIERVNTNSYKTEQAVCSVVLYVEQQLPNVPNPDAKTALRRLALNMRETGVRCPPSRSD